MGMEDTRKKILAARNFKSFAKASQKLQRKRGLLYMDKKMYKPENVGYVNGDVFTLSQKYKVYL